jgi:UTP--glucose-1-phosphate uridylyltransferase
LAISEFVEKPTREYAREKLITTNLVPNHYLTLSGQYILTPTVIQYLEEHIQNKYMEYGEYQLTSCLEKVRKEEGFYGCLINGKRFDIGQPESYRHTVMDFPEGKQINDDKALPATILSNN